MRRQVGWEVLDGWSDGVDFDIELGRECSIDKAGVSSVEVTLLDGRTFDRDGSNVDVDNRGIFVTVDTGRTAPVQWADFESLVLER